MRLDHVVTRRLLPVINDRLGEAPVVVLSGPRSVGKSTLLKAVGGAHDRTVLDLDDPVVREGVQADPALFLGSAELVLVDEYARVPEVLDVIKAELNRDTRPGRFLLAGSTRYGSVPRIAQTLTGRVELLPIWPLSQGEIAETHESFIEQVVTDSTTLVSTKPSVTQRSDYAERVVAGGMPLALQQPNDVARSRWFDTYLRLVFEKDVLEISRVRQRVALPRLATALSARTGQILNISNVASEVGLERTTAENYIKLLEAVFLLHLLPAWGTILTARGSASPKVHLVDAGLAGRLLRVTPAALAAASPQALTQFGHLLETFVVGELLKQVAWLEEPVLSGHWRTYDGHEVDLVLETSDGRVIGIEVKASSRVRKADLVGLELLRRRVGSAFLVGVVLHTGELEWHVNDAIVALPIDRIWR